MKLKLRHLLIVPALLWTSLITGCVSLGGKTEVRHTFVNLYDDTGREVIAGRVAKNVKVPVVIVDKDGNVSETTMDIGGWNVSHPAPPKENKTGE